MTEKRTETKQAWAAPRLEKLGDIKDVGGKPPPIAQGGDSKS